MDRNKILNSILAIMPGIIAGIMLAYAWVWVLSSRLFIMPWYMTLLLTAINTIIALSIDMITKQFQTYKYTSKIMIVLSLVIVAMYCIIVLFSSETMIIVNTMINVVIIHVVPFVASFIFERVYK